MKSVKTEIAWKLTWSLMVIVNSLWVPAQNVSNSTNQARAVQTKAPTIAIYLLADAQLNLKDVVRRPLAELTLADKPWLSPSEVDFYDASTHIIYFKAGVKPKTIKGALQGIPFVLTARGQRLFLGVFWSLYSSLGPEAGTPLIYAPLSDTGMEFIQIRATKMQHEGRRVHLIPDPDVNRPLEDAFREAGCLREGLSLSLKAIRVERHNGGETTVRYTYCLTNQDTDTLLILDPDKTGSPKFHYFTNGIYLVPRDGNRSGVWKILENYVRLPGRVNLDPSWLTALSPGSSIERSVEMPLDPEVGPGDYQASFRFPSPLIKNIQETHLPAGRLWLGELDAQLIVEVQ